MRPDPGETWNQALSRMEREVGPLQVVRRFYTGAPKDLDSITRITGADISVSFKLEPDAVLSGTHDQLLNAWFANLPTDRAIYWTYHHEPENPGKNLDPASYRAAWNHIIAIAKRHPSPRVKSTLILMSFSLRPGSGRDWRDWYPGPVVDILGWDAYSRTSRGGYQSPTEIYGPLIAASRSAGKPFAIGETASGLVPGDDGRQRAAWMREIAKYLADEGAVFASYFNSNVGDGTDYRLHDQASLDAWKAVLRQY